MLLHNHKSKSFGCAIEHTIVQHHTTNPPCALSLIRYARLQEISHLVWDNCKTCHLIFLVQIQLLTTGSLLPCIEMVIQMTSTGQGMYSRMLRYFFIAETVLMIEVLSNEILYKVCSMYT